MSARSILEAIVASSSDAVIAADVDGIIVSWNKAAERTFGHSSKEAVGQSLAILMPERFREAHNAGIARVAKTGKKKVIGQVLELTGLHKDGHEFPIELTLSTAELDGTRYFGGVIRDVTERANLTAELTQSESRMRAVMDTTSDAIISIDQNGHVVLWNHAAEQMLGHSTEEMVGKPLNVIIPEKFHALHDAGIARVVAGGERHVIGKTAQLSAHHKDGHEFPIELSLSTWESGGQRFFSGIIRDVTERAKLITNLSLSEQRMRAVMDSATDAIICADENGDIIHWNPASEELFGRTTDEVVGNSLTVIIPERYREMHEAGIERIRNHGEPHVIGKAVELQAIHSDGHEFPIELSLGTWETDGKRYFSGIVRDITLRKQADAKIAVATKALDDKNQQLEALSIKLAKYLSKQVYDSIFTGKRDVKVESYRKNLTVFFSDIQGFTDLTDKMEAEIVSDLLNQYLSEMAIIAEEFGGTVDKFIGDGVMIFFGDPETHGEKADAIACVRMALRMRSRVKELTQEWAERGAGALHVRIGINTGYCTVGNFGSDERMDYTIVGGQVNLTSRLENSAAADQILISHTTYALVKDEVYCRPVGDMQVKGIARPIQTFEAVSTREEYLAEAKKIEHAGDAFNVSVDLTALGQDERKRAKESLLSALEALEGDT